MTTVYGKGGNFYVEFVLTQVTQLHFRNSTLSEQVKKLEDDLAEADHHEEDLIEHNKILSRWIGQLWVT